uniref:type II toxin-antitoxin system VapC family toxin n=1 Tax=Candidatus Electrothrix sp. TaxID=2170559 RepID=UPI0040567FED
MLLDTHVFLWWLFDEPDLPEKMRDHIRSTENPVYISSASVWEIATKYRIGKLPHAGTVAKNVPYWIDNAGFTSLPITPEHAQLAGSWAQPHRDPFDRMLAAQAKLENLTLISLDKQLKSFPIQLMER